MNILVSSKLMYQKLSEIDFDTVSLSVADVIAVNGGIELVLSDYKKIEIPCEVSGYLTTQSQFQARFDWVKKLLGQVDEQPVNIIIDGKNLTVAFHY